MELPESLIEGSIEEQHIYFFTDKAPIGIPNHMHVCIKVKDKLLLFSTCASQTDTVFRLAQLKGWDVNTFPCFKKSTDNLFDRELTFINCNNIITCTKKDFTKMLSNGSVVSLEGRLTDNDMKLVAQGVKKSITVPKEIKELFR